MFGFCHPSHSESQDGSSPCRHRPFHARPRCNVNSIDLRRENSQTNCSGRANISHTKRSPRSNLRSVLEQMSLISANQ